MKNNNRFFYCYDKTLKDVIISSGLSYNCYGLHPRTNRLFWQFDVTSALCQVLEEFNSKKNEIV